MNLEKIAYLDMYWLVITSSRCILMLAVCGSGGVVSFIRCNVLEEFDVKVYNSHEDILWIRLVAKM